MEKKKVTLLGKNVSEYKHVLVLSYYLVIGLLYLYVNKTILPEDIEVLMRFPLIDDRIPFIKYMVVPYYIWYPYIIVPLVYFAFKDKDAFLQLAKFMFGGMTIGYIFFILVPNGIGIGFRPEITETDIFSRFIKNIYEVDNPTNSCPSLHVLVSIAVHGSICYSKQFKEKRWIVWGSGITAFFICASTVFIKQHSIIDVVVSLVLGWVMWKVLYKKKEEVTAEQQVEILDKA